MATLPASPLRVLTMPVSVALRLGDALLALPEIQRDVRRMADATEVLPAVLEQLQGVSRSTEVMPELDRHVQDIERALPVLVELERSLPALTPAIAVLADSLERLLVLLDRLDGTVNTLALLAEPLQGPAERLGRFAGRLPGRTRP
jgi:hypothetical protein